MVREVIHTLGPILVDNHSVVTGPSVNARFGKPLGMKHDFMFKGFEYNRFVQNRLEGHEKFSLVVRLKLVVKGKVGKSLDLGSKKLPKCQQSVDPSKQFGEMAIQWYFIGVTSNTGAAMVSIQIDEQTAEALKAAATAAGVSISEFLKLMVPATKQPLETAWDSLEREFTALSVEGSLPATFSRADIYADHD